MSLYYKTNQIQQLRGFYYTAQLKSITMAAKFMGLTQPSVSLQVQSLEDRLETKLFYRQGNSMELTLDGEKIYEKVKGIVESVDDIYVNFPKFKGEEIRELNVVANHGSIIYILPWVIKKFNEIDKNHVIKIHYAPKEKGLDMLAKGKADIFVTPKNMDIPSEFEYNNLRDCKVFLITSLDHDLSKKKDIKIEDLAEYNVVMPTADLGIIDYQEVFARNNSKFECRLEFANWEVTRIYAIAGVAMTFTVDIGIESIDNRVFKYDFSDYFDDVSYGYITNKKQEKSEVLKKFIETMEWQFSEGKFKEESSK